MELSLPGDPTKGSAAPNQLIKQEWTITTNGSDLISGHIRWPDGAGSGTEVRFGETPDSIWWASAGDLLIFSKNLQTHEQAAAHEVELGAMTQFVSQARGELKNILTYAGITTGSPQILDAEQRQSVVKARLNIDGSEVDAEFQPMGDEYVIASLSRGGEGSTISWQFSDHQRINGAYVPRRLVQTVESEERGASQFVYKNVGLLIEDPSAVYKRLFSPQKDPVVLRHVHVVVTHDVEGPSVRSADELRTVAEQ